MRNGVDRVGRISTDPWIAMLRTAIISAVLIGLAWRLGG